MDCNENRNEGGEDDHSVEEGEKLEAIPIAEENLIDFEPISLTSSRSDETIESGASSDYNASTSSSILDWPVPNHGPTVNDSDFRALFHISQSVRDLIFGRCSYYNLGMLMVSNMRFKDASGNGKFFVSTVGNWYDTYMFSLWIQAAEHDFKNDQKTNFKMKVINDWKKPTPLPIITPRGPYDPAEDVNADAETIVVPVNTSPAASTSQNVSSPPTFSVQSPILQVSSQSLLPEGSRMSRVPSSSAQPLQSCESFSDPQPSPSHAVTGCPSNSSASSTIVGTCSASLSNGASSQPLPNVRVISTSGSALERWIFTIPRSRAGILIGYRGATHRALSAQFNLVGFNISQRESEGTYRTVELYGEKSNLTKAYREIYRLLEMRGTGIEAAASGQRTYRGEVPGLGAGQTLEVIRIPASLIGIFIGHGGSSITEMETSTNTIIFIMQDDPLALLATISDYTDVDVYVQGAPDDVQSALTRIQQFIDSYL